MSSPSSDSSAPQEPSPRARHQLPWFIAVGVAAAAVHWGVVKLLVDATGLAPLWANLWGWLVAFGVSFGGHHRLTFAAHQAPLRSSLPKFFLISAGGFAVNEATYAFLLRHASWRYDLTLAVVLVAVAVLTFVTSRLWAFRHAGPPGPANPDPGARAPRTAAGP